MKIPWRSRSAAILVDQGIASGTTLLITAILFRTVGVEVYGAFSLVWIVLMFSVSVQYSGLVIPAYSLIPKLSSLDASWFRFWLLMLQFGLSLLLPLVLVLADGVLGISLLPEGAGLLAASCFLISRLFFTFFRLVLFLREDGPFRAMMVDSIHSVLAVGGLLLAAFHGGLDLDGVLLVLAGASAVAALVAAPLWFRLGCRPVSGAGKGLPLRHWRLSSWLIGKSVAQWFTGNSFLVALGVLEGTAALGMVRAAQTIVGAAGVVLQGFENFFPVKAARTWAAAGPDGLRRALLRDGRIWGAILVLALIPLVVFPDSFASLLLGKTFPGVQMILLVLSVGAVLALSIQSISACLRAVERTRPLFFAQAAAGLAGAVLAAPVVSRFGIPGCLAGLIGQQVVLLGCLVLPLRTALRTV